MDRDDRAYFELEDAKTFEVVESDGLPYDLVEGGYQSPRALPSRAGHSSNDRRSNLAQMEEAI
jgi:hypothetical protein